MTDTRILRGSTQVLITSSGPARNWRESAQILILSSGPARVWRESAQILVYSSGPARVISESTQILFRKDQPHFKWGLPIIGDRVFQAPPNGNAVLIGSSSQFVPWPSGTVEGDLIVIQYESGWFVVVPTDWTNHYNVQGGNGSGEVVSKCMSAADITAGGVTLTTTGGSFPGHCNIVRIPGKGAPTVLENTGQTGLIQIGVSPSNVEQVVSNCDLDLSSVGATCVIDWDFWWSMSEGGGGKFVTFRVRKDNLSGTVLASGVLGATIDSTAGHNRQFAGQVTDSTPTTGRYVLTVQCTGGFTSPIYSDSRIFRVSTNRPGVRKIVGGYSGAGFTSVGVDAGIPEVNDTALFMVGHRVNAVQDSSRGTLLGRQNAANASGGVWWEDVISTASSLTTTFTSPSAGSNSLPQIVLVSNA